MADAGASFELIQGEYYLANQEQFSVIGRHMDTLHDGRLPAVVGYSASDIPEPIVAGTRTAAHIAETKAAWDGVPLTRDEAVQAAAGEYKAARNEIVLAVGSVLELVTEHFPTIAGSLLRRLGKGYVIPDTFREANFTQTWSVGRGGEMVRTASTHVEGIRRTGLVSLRSLHIDNQTTDLGLHFLEVGGKPVVAGCHVNTSLNYLYDEAVAVSHGQEEDIQRIMEARVPSDFAAAESVYAFWQKQEAAGNLLVAPLAGPLYRHAAEVRRARREVLEPGSAALPSARTLHAVRYVLGARLTRLAS